MNAKAWIAEFVGTFVLVFACIGVAANHFMTDGQWGGLAIAIAPGIAVAVMATATMAVSGGHINPAVTLGFFVTHKIDFINAVGYIVMQCLGAVAAAGFVKLMIPHSVLTAIQMDTPHLGVGVSTTTGLLAEIILTFILVFVIYGTAFDRRAPKTGGLYIGLVVTMNILIGDALTGASMNPARHLGPALLSQDYSHIWLYWTGPIIGSILAGWCYTKCVE